MMFREAFERHGFVVLLTCFLSQMHSVQVESEQFENPARLRNLLILVDQPVQHLPASHSDRGQIGNRCRKRVAVGWALPAALMRVLVENLAMPLDLVFVCAR